MDKKKRGSVNIDQIDLEKEREKITEDPGMIAYPHHVGSAIVKPEDRGKIKGRAVTAMHEQTDRQMQQIYGQMQTLIHQARSLKKRVELSERIYLTRLNFEPIIGHEYHLYRKKDGKDILSMVAPEEWGDRMPYEVYIARVKLLADHTWEVLESYEVERGTLKLANG